MALRALVARLEKSIAEIRSDGLVSPDELAFPSERTIPRLEQRSAGAATDRVDESNAQTLQSFLTSAFNHGPKSETMDDASDGVVLSRASEG